MYLFRKSFINMKLSTIQHCSNSHKKLSLYIHSLLHYDKIKISEWKAHSINDHAFCLRFDYSGRSPIEFKGQSRMEVAAHASGKVDAVFMWWDLQMDVKGDVMLSCAPKWAHPEPDQLQVRSSFPSHTSLSLSIISLFIQPILHISNFCLHDYYLSSKQSFPSFVYCFSYAYFPLFRYSSTRYSTATNTIHWLGQLTVHPRSLVFLHVCSVFRVPLSGLVKMLNPLSCSYFSPN